MFASFNADLLGISSPAYVLVVSCYQLCSSEPPISRFGSPDPAVLQLEHTSLDQSTTQGLGNGVCLDLK